METAVGFGDIDTQKAELAATLDQRASQLPVLLLEAIEQREDVVVDKIGDRLRDQALLVVELFRSQNARGVGRLEQPFAAAQSRCCRRSGGHKVNPSPVKS